MSSSRPIRLPVGVRDFLPRAASRRRAIAERLLAVFESWGYQRIITPMFEHFDVLERGLGEDARAAAIRFVEPGTGEVVALRPDITPQVARLAATRMGGVSGPLRLCYEGAVTRLVGGPRGQREILQAGVELLAADSPDGDAEALAVAAAALASTGVSEIGLDVGHVSLARYVLESIEDAELRHDIKQLLAKKDRAGVAELAAGLPLRIRKLADELPTLFGSQRKVLQRARALSLPARVRRGLDTLEAVLAMSRDTVPADVHRRITVDLGEVRGFEYYTGMRFAGYTAGHGDAVLRGGRYDELVGCYGRECHATGFAVDIEGIAAAQRVAGVRPVRRRGGVLVWAASGERPRAMRIASALRGLEARCAVDLGNRRGRSGLIAYARATEFDHLLVLDARSEIVDVSIDPAEAIPVSRDVIRRAAAGDAAPLVAAACQLGARSKGT